MGLGEAVPSIGSCVAGLLFGTAWLLWIDGVAFAATEYGEAVNGAYWVPGTLQTIGLIMVNVINWGLLTDDSMMDDGAVAGKAKAWVVVAFVLCFSGVIGSVWILVQEMQHPSWDAGGGAVDTAVRCLLQNLFLFGSSLPAKLTRPPCLAPNRPLVPASRVLYVPKAQGSLARALHTPHARRYAYHTRACTAAPPTTHLGRRPVSRRPHRRLGRVTARGTRSECRLLAASLAASTKEVSACGHSGRPRVLVCSLVRGRRDPCLCPVYGLPGGRAPGARHVHVDCLSLTFHK